MGAGERGFKAIRKTRTATKIIDQIRDLVAGGHLTPGDRLPSERELATALGVGRSTVREALRAMEALGLVQVRAGEGTFLVGAEGQVDPDPLSPHLFRGWASQLTLFEVRLVLEPGLTGLAARRATPAQLAAMQRVLKQQAVRVQRGEDAMQEDVTFHARIAAASGNPVLVHLAQTLTTLHRQTWEPSAGRGARRLAPCGSTRRSCGPSRTGMRARPSGGCTRTSAPLNAGSSPPGGRRRSFRPLPPLTPPEPARSAGLAARRFTAIQPLSSVKASSAVHSTLIDSLA
jgi:GntR family transcriptional repressor for pyruvate dehydrogenase complex